MSRSLTLARSVVVSPSRALASSRQGATKLHTQHQQLQKWSGRPEEVLLWRASSAVIIETSKLQPLIIIFFLVNVLSFWGELFASSFLSLFFFSWYVSFLGKFLCCFVVFVLCFVVVFRNVFWTSSKCYDIWTTRMLAWRYDRIYLWVPLICRAGPCLLHRWWIIHEVNFYLMDCVVRFRTLLLV